MMSANGRAMRWIAFGWLTVALASAPAIYLSTAGEARGPLAVGLAAMLYAICTYMPWAVATPLMLGTCERLPIGERSTGRNLVILAITAMPTTFLLSASGAILGRVVLWGIGAQGIDHPLQNIGRPIFVTTLFALPTYVAIIGIGQTLGWAARDQRREQQLIDAREQAMRANLQPHFLFNALNAIAEIGHSDPQRADDALVHLSGILRTSLEAPAVHTLSEEIAITRDLVALHQLLLGDRLAWTSQVPADSATALVPALILQPLIENALKHAGDSVGLGTVSLDVENGLRHLRVTIENSCGDTPRPGTGRGLSMVRSRLAAIYGEGADLRTELVAGGFRAVVTLPATYT